MSDGLAMPSRRERRRVAVRDSDVARPRGDAVAMPRDRATRYSVSGPVVNSAAPNVVSPRPSIEMNVA